MRHRLIPTLFVMIVVAAVVLIGLLLALDSRRATSFARVSPNMTERAVESLLGRPDDRKPGCRDAPTWLGAPVVSASCEFELTYYANVGPRFWTVGFGAKRLVIAKYEYVSP